MKIGPSQGSSPKESPLAGAEEGYTAGEEALESGEGLAQGPSEDHQLETLSGHLNQWRHSGLKTQSPDMTILNLTDGLPSQTERSSWTEFLRVAERGHADPDQHDLQDKTNLLASGG